ncbi:MAG TPA: SDR family NAD(P)-dependent oxidoreductase [Chloroflexi bacterium]|nr:SDR family NAD(P)-dependent oxidoreductase [Chloroflexota bacterium]
MNVSQRVLVTGAAGFIGQHLVRRLLEDGAQVWAGIAPAEAPERVAQLPADVRQISFDVRDTDAVRSAVADVDPQIVFHLAAVGVTDTGVDPQLALIVNAGGAVNVLAALRGRDVKRVVLAGTCHEYGARETSEGLDPLNAYAASKIAAWAFGRAFWRVHGLPVVTARLFQVYGPGQPAHVLIPAAIRAAMDGRDFPMTQGDQARDFVYVADVVDGLIAAALASDLDGHSIDLGMGVPHTVRHVVERIWALTEASGKIQAGVLPYRAGAVMSLIANADRTTRLTGWCAQLGLDDGLRAMVRYLSLIEGDGVDGRT